MQSGDTILRAENLAIGYRNGKRETVVMQELDVELHSHCLTALLGRNGIGKSTLLRTIAGSQPPLSGRVMYGCRNISEYSRRDMSHLLSLVYTDRTQAGGLTVEQLVSLGRYPHTGFFGRLDNHDREVVAEAMAATGIGHKSGEFVAELSDGERQKAMIARALAQETPVIMLDEPTAFLDVSSRIEVMTLLRRLTREQGKAVLLSTHDIAQTLPLADELWIVTHDRQVLHGCTEDLVLEGHMQEMFGASADGMEFDMYHGDFDVPLSSGTGYQLECDDSVLRHWVANAMHRNGLSTAGTLGRIVVKSHNDITVMRGKVTVDCTSIAELLSAII